MDLRPALLALLLCAAQPGLHAATPLHMAPAPMLAMQMHDMVGVSAWLVSEKLDGVRARWDGRRLLTRNGDPIDLQPREFQLLEYLLRHAEQVVTRTMLLEGVWDFHFDPRTNIVETHISRLRSKINRGGDPELIHTIRGSGYCLRAPAKTL